MPFAIEITKNTFAAGEVSPELRARSDLAKAQTGLWYLENMIVLLEGGVTRRPGTQMIVQLAPGHAYVMIPFRFSGSGSNAYLIVIGNGVAQFILFNGVVQAPGGGNYTVAVPYQDADLGGDGATTAGVSNLRWAASGNVIYLFCDGYAPQTLTRNADNSWTLAPYITQPANPAPQGGCIAPVDTENVDPVETISISATQGTITLNASAQFAGASATVPNGFQAGHVGSVWRLDESNLSFIPEWEGDQAVTINLAQVTSNDYIGSMASPQLAFGAQAAAQNSGASQNAANGWIGVALATPTAIAQAQIVIYAEDNLSGLGAIYNCSLYGSLTAPANSTDGVLLGSAGVGSGGLFTIQSNDPVTNYGWVWLYWTVNIARETFVDWVYLQGLAAAQAPTLQRWDGNVYQALNNGNTGDNPPVHTSGSVMSGQGGVEWLYRTRGYGFVQIQSVQSPTQATAVVLERLPDSILQQATANWWPSAWDAIKGWPDRGIIYSNSLVAARQQKWWETQAGTFNNWDIIEGGSSSSPSAIAAGLISPTGSLPWIEWFAQKEFLYAGTRDDEWSLAGQDPFSPISIDNLDPYPASNIGSAIHVPAAAEGGMVMISRDRTKAFLLTTAFSGVMPAISPQELTATARHILGVAGGGALGVSRQTDPNRINWFWCANGLVVGNTLMREQTINGWHRHPPHAATQSKVLGIASIPSNDEGQSWTYFLTQRTINGVEALFVELLAPYFQPADWLNPTAAGAYFVDCGTTYSFPEGVTEIGGLGYLAGCELAINADGCEYRNPDGSRVVVPANGSITLTRTTFSGAIGLPIKYRIRTLPFDFAMLGRSTEGERQKANHVYLWLVNSAGGKVRINPQAGADIPAEPINEMASLTGARTFGDPVPLYTGPYRTPAIESALDDMTIVEVEGDDTMPFTLSGVAPDVVVEESA